MTTIAAKVILSSVGPGHKKPLSTLQLRYPRFIHDELLTHRVFSRNASSSRAIPVSRMIRDIEEDPAVPLHWGLNEPGMQARQQLTGLALATAQAYWREDREHSILMAKSMAGTNAAKQIVNRLIQNHGHINVVVTSTEWNNFLHVRDHPDAEPHIEMLAKEIGRALEFATPQLLGWNEWHLPYVSGFEIDHYSYDDCLLLSVSRCARVSYRTHDDKKPDYEADLALARKLIAGDPLHASPAEHQGHPLPEGQACKNFIGWYQYRAALPGENHA